MTADSTTGADADVVHDAPPDGQADADVVHDAPPDGQADAEVSHADSPDGQVGTKDPPDGPNPNAESARWRRKYRAEETHRRIADSRVDKLNRREITRLAAERLTDGEDIWRDDELDVTGLLDSDGVADPAKVAAHLDGLLDRRTHWAKRANSAPPAKLVTGDGKPPAPQPEATWETVLRPNTQ